MFGFTGPREIFIVFLVICVLSMTGMWPKVIRAFREFRGEHFDYSPQATLERKEEEGLELCFRMLGLSPSAQWDEIERAYRQKAKIHHPDRGGDADAMRALNDAYARLKKARRPQQA